MQSSLLCTPPPTTHTHTHSHSHTHNHTHSHSYSHSHTHPPHAPRVIVGREYYEPAGLEPEVPVQAALSLVLRKKLPRAPGPGVLPSSQFPAAYFSLGCAEQWYGAELLDALDDVSGVRLREAGGEGAFWRFNRIHGGGRGPGSVEGGGQGGLLAGVGRRCGEQG